MSNRPHRLSDETAENIVILNCNYEELTALSTGARSLLERSSRESSAVAAPPAALAAIEVLLPRLHADLSMATLHEQRGLQAALYAIVEFLRIEMEALVVVAHPADEDAVTAYFEFAHGLSVLRRVQELGREMAAMIELVTGSPPTNESTRTFVFPD